MWVCLCGDGKSLKDPQFNVEKETRRLFINEVDDIYIVPVGEGEYYILADCHDYFSHSEDIRRAKWVINILNSYDDPVFLSREEVDKFVESSRAGDSDYFNIGDAVLALDGSVSGLYGIVVACSDNSCDVLFRFNTTDVVKTVANHALKSMGSIFKHHKAAIDKQSVEYHRCARVERI
tara:strand:- start:4799 stop:5332 length:534 start_codon:yes stop_codon:yes gene_type:complete